MKQKMHKLSVNVVDFILVKQLVGVMKERSNTKLWPKDVISPHIVKTGHSIKWDDFTFINGY